MELGPEVDDAPRGLPVRQIIRGRYVVLEPLHRRHVGDLWDASRGAETSWTYMGYGPFAARPDLERFIGSWAAAQDSAVWAVRPVTTGLASGWLSLMSIEPANAAIELGNIWFSPALQRTRAATEAMYLLLAMAADDLGYRRLVWKCNALNEGSRRAAERLGFTFEGILRAHQIVKGRRRDTAMYSMLTDEWPVCAAALRAWLAPENFAPDGSAIASLAALRTDGQRS
jgi:RimJ/RimL family protein N-acetyltransferase